MTATQQLPRVKWRPKFPIAGFLSGLVGGFGLLIFLQQAAVLLPTQNLSIAFVLGGGLGAVVLRNVAARMAVARMNGRLSAIERQMASSSAAPAPAVAAVAEPAVAAEPLLADEEVVADRGAEWVATHVVPSAGMPAWAEPDKSGPPETQLEAGLELRVLDRANGLAHVEAYNGWTAWVDGRSLRRKHA